MEGLNLVFTVGTLGRCIARRSWCNGVIGLKAFSGGVRISEAMRFSAHDLPILSSCTISKLSRWPCFRAGHFCAFDGTYIDQHINATVVGLDER
jgi:hypothetical protein